MMTIEQIRKHMSDRNVSEVARRIGVTGSWLREILRPETKHLPGYETLAKLSDYLEKTDG